MTKTREPVPSSLYQLLGLSHLQLLAAMIALLVVQSFLGDETIIQRTLFNLLILAVVVSSIRTLSQSNMRLVAALALGVIGFVGSCVTEWYPSQRLVAAVYVCYIAIFLALCLTLCEDVFAGGTVNVNRIIGAVCIFFVLGLIWAFVYSLLHLFDPAAFAYTASVDSGGIPLAAVSEFLYFSNVTLTTLGYGDIVPVSKPARMFASLEAMLGQVYMATVIARLVGLHISSKN